MEKAVVGYEGLYTITSSGKIYNKFKKVMKCSNTKGYRKINLTKDKVVRTYKVHRLVAQAFLCNPEEYPEVDHRDEDKTNNDVSNLRWCSSQMNKNYFNGKDEFALKVDKESVHGTMDAFIEAVGKSIVVNEVLYRSCGEAARMIADAEGKNKDTVSKELRRMLQGKREFGWMYEDYLISPPDGEERNER